MYALITHSFGCRCQSIFRTAIFERERLCALWGCAATLPGRWSRLGYSPRPLGLAPCSEARILEKRKNPFDEHHVAKKPQVSEEKQGQWEKRCWHRGPQMSEGNESPFDKPYSNSEHSGVRPRVCGHDLAANQESACCQSRATHFNPSNVNQERKIGVGSSHATPAARLPFHDLSPVRSLACQCLLPLPARHPKSIVDKSR